MTDEIHAYPLCWPDGWPRARRRERSRFSDPTVAKGIKESLYQLRLMGIPDRLVIISSNVALRQDGLPRSDQRIIRDPGAAVYFTQKDRRMVIALDAYDRVQDNLWAIGKTLEAMRSIKRWGGGQLLERAFTGFQKLDSPASWRAALSLPPDATLSDATAQYRKLAQQYHPDRGGDSEAFDKIRKAYDRAKEELS